MIDSIRAVLALSAVLLLPAPAISQRTPPPQKVQYTTTEDTTFAQMKTLIGTWRNADAPNSTLRIRFYLTAGGTTLVESWERAGNPHSLTLYHRDGANLLATHYCPQGNQPRLALVANAGEIRFTFRDATDLTKDESYLHDLAFDLTDPVRVIRHETYWQGAKKEETMMSLIRVEPEA